MEAKIRSSATQYDDALIKLAKTKADHGVWQRLDGWPVGGNKGKAASMRQSLVTRWGASPAVNGFRFKTIRGVDEDVLGVMYTPDGIIPGASEDWERMREAKRMVAAEKARLKKAEAKLAAEKFTEQYEETDDDETAGDDNGLG